VAADFGYDRAASYWTGPGRGWLAELDLPAVSREIVTDCLASIDALAPVIERLDGELHQRAKAGPRVKILRTLPGVGEFTALVMLAEIGDISRFASARKLARWAGLTPTVHRPRCIRALAQWLHDYAEKQHPFQGRSIPKGPELPEARDRSRGRDNLGGCYRGGCWNSWLPRPRAMNKISGYRSSHRPCGWRPAQSIQVMA
jgi:Transposase IS116/IS110/IS902 family